jgi:outer membrane lipoprotein SlyB
MVASVAAVGIKDGVSKAANMGKESRGVAEDDRYKFGDVSRGFAASIRKSTTEGKKNRGMSGEDKYSFGDFSRGVSSSFRSNSHHYSSEYDADGDMDEDGVESGRSESYMAKNKARYGAVAGSSVGAMVGLAVAGPFGLVAGSLAGGVATQSYISKKQEAKAEGRKGLIDLRAHEENGEQYDQSEPGQGFAAVGRPKATVTVATATASRESLPSQDGQARPFRLGDNLRYLTRKEEVKIDQKKGLIDLQAEEENGNQYEQNAEEKLPSPEGGGQPYRLGDNLRGLVSRGQKAAGRDEGSPYKFGDLSRGLFSSKR